MTGILCGVINGVLVTVLGITDFVATLATLSAFRGVLFLMTQGVPFASFSNDTFAFIGRGQIWGIPTPFILCIVMFAVLLYFLRQTVFGRHLLSVGSNQTAARLSGVKVKLTKLWVYVLSGFCSGLAGIMLASRLSSVPPDLGQGYELTTIAAVVIGGTSLFGGRGSLFGTVIGALLIAMISNGLILLNVNPFYQYIINGALIAFAVALNRIRQR